MQATMNGNGRRWPGCCGRWGGRAPGFDLGYRRGFNSGPMLDYVYRNRPGGAFPLGVLTDWVYLNTIGWRAIRARKVLLKAVLRAEVARRIAAGPVVLADVAAGPGRYYWSCARSGRRTGGPWPTRCRSFAATWTGKGWPRGAARRWRWGWATCAMSRATRPTRHRWRGSARAGFVVVSGLYELFTDPAPIRRSLRGIFAALKPGGTLVFTTQVTHPQLDLIANVLVNREGRPWVMVCRSLAEVGSAGGGGRVRAITSQCERHGLFGITVCRKPGAGG